MICKVTVLTHLSCPGPCRGAWHTSGGGAGVEGGEAAGLGPALLCQQQLQLAGLQRLQEGPLQLRHVRPQRLAWQHHNLLPLLEGQRLVLAVQLVDGPVAALARVVAPS